MTSPSTDVTAAPKPAALGLISWDFLVRAAISAALLIAYYALRVRIVDAVLDLFAGFLASPGDSWLIAFGKHVIRATPAWLAAALLVALVVVWRRTLARDKRWHAPLLVVSVLIMADAGYGILESHNIPFMGQLTGGLLSTFSPTFAAILAAVLAEALIGRFFYGKWPHLASSFVSGISAGILIKSPELWPFVACALISITSKYVLRIGERHLWNPTNLGMTMMLFLAPQHVASLSVEAGNEWAATLVIWLLGGLILYQLGRLAQPVTFVLCFVPLALLRSWWSGQPWLAEVAPITSPMFQLFIFFMITDPKTTVKSKWWQVVVVVLVAVAETFYRVAFRDVHSLYHSLFTVGPIANLIEIGYDRLHQKAARPAPKDGGPFLPRSGEPGALEAIAPRGAISPQPGGGV